jgi:hypothetical protein
MIWGTQSVKCNCSGIWHLGRKRALPASQGCCKAGVLTDDVGSQQGALARGEGTEARTTNQIQIAFVFCIQGTAFRLAITARGQ